MINVKRNSVLLLLNYCLFVSTGMAQYDPSKNMKSGPFPWPEGKRCAISLTFDDARPSQIDTGVPLFNKYGVKVTFYISPNRLMDRIDGWKAAVQAGHEIGNHTMTHPCTGNYSFSHENALENYTLDAMALDIDKANDLILEKLNVKATNFAYPCGQSFVGRGADVKSYVPLISRKFVTGRGWLGEGSNDPWFCDFSQLQGMESDGKSFDELKILMEKAAAEGRWLVLAGHEIGTGGHQTTRVSSLEKVCQYAQNPAHGIWIDTVASVAGYILQVRKSPLPK